VAEGTGTALLVMDVQRVVVERYVKEPKLLERIATAIRSARASGVQVFYVFVGFRPGYPEIGQRSRWFGTIAKSGDFITGDVGTEIHPEVAPESGDILVKKLRVGAFAGSDLEVLLRSRGIGSLALTGIATGGVVLSTVRHAADLDFRLSVLSDACADMDPEVHKVLLEKVFPRQANVLTVDQWVAELATSNA